MNSSKVAAKDDKSAAAPPASMVSLMDEHWFYNNALNARRKHRNKLPLAPRRSSSPILEHDDDGSSLDQVWAKVSGSAEHSLLCSPTLPPHRLVVPEAIPEEEEDVAAPGTNEPNRVRDTKTLCRYPSMPAATCEGGSEERRQRYMLRHSLSSLDGQQSKNRISRASTSICSRYDSFKAYKSTSDLESIEVQGFKDLGFVFDKDELKQTLCDVIPGLRNKSENDDRNAEERNVVRPYLSEAWFVPRSAPPAIKLTGRPSSAAEMKDQIRFWAHAIACNVKQEL